MFLILQYAFTRILILLRAFIIKIILLLESLVWRERQKEIV